MRASNKPGAIHYQVGADLCLDQAQTGSLAASARRLTIGVTDGSGTNYDFAQSDAAPNSHGTTRLSTAATVPAGASNAFIRLMNGSRTTVVWWHDLEVEEAGDLSGTNLITGSMTDRDGVRFVWTGGAHDSRSQMIVDSILRSGTSTQQVSAGGGAAVYRSSEWASRGAWSARIDPIISTSTATALYPFGQSGASDNIGWQAGETWTVSATIRLDEAQTGELDVMARRIVIGGTYPGGVNVWRFAASPAAPNAAGEYRLAITFEVPEQAENAFIRLMNGSRRQSVWWDELLVEKTGTQRDYFDGDTGQWTGTPHASTSLDISAQGNRIPAGDLANGTIAIPNRGNATAYPLIDLTGTHSALTISSGGTVTHVTATPYGQSRTVDLRNGVVWDKATGTRDLSALTGGLVSVKPGGSAWTITGLGTGTAHIRRFEAWK